MFRRKKGEGITIIERHTVWKGSFVLSRGLAGVSGLSLTAFCDSENSVEVRSCLSSKERDLAGAERVPHLKYSWETSSMPYPQLHGLSAIAFPCKNPLERELCIPEVYESSTRVEAIALDCSM